MENKLLVAILVAILVLGGDSVVSVTGMHSWAKKKMGGFDERGFGKQLPFFGKNERSMVGMPEGLKEELGLPEDATDEQVKDALIQKKEQEANARLATVKEKLGLPEDSSYEQVSEALSAWREENKDLLTFNIIRPGGFRG